MTYSRSHDSPVRVGGGKYNRRAGVGVTGDPGAVDGKQHEEHHEEKDNNRPKIRRVGKFTRLVSRVNTHRSLRRFIFLFGLGVFRLCVHVTGAS